MTSIDHHIYLSRIDGLSLDEQSEPLGAALCRSAAGARRITVVSAYYNADAVIKLFRSMGRNNRRACTLRLVFSVEHAAQLVGALEPLRQLRRDLAQLGFQNPEVKLYRPEGGAPLHTKLYYFLRGNQPSWFVGSANLSGAIDGDRHEMMVRLTGSHQALQDYMNAVVERAVSAQDKDAGTLADGVPRNLRSFFLSGFVCYSPRERLGMTFEACKLSPRHRAVLKSRLEEEGGIPYANAQAEGFGFSLLRALTNNGSTGDLVSEGDDRIMARFRHLAVETSLGYWLPGPYATIVRASVQQVEERAEAALRDLARQLKQPDMAALAAALKQHVEAMKNLIPDGPDKIMPKADLESLFKSFVDVRSKQLGDDGMRHRLARRLQLTRLPDFWGDQEAVDEFEETFFDNLTLRLRKEGNVPHIVAVFRDKLNLWAAGKGSLREVLERHLEEKGWGIANWTLPAGHRPV